MGRKSLIVLAVAAGLAVAPASAVASTAQGSPLFGSLSVDADQNVAHDVTVTLAAGTFTVTDAAGITPADATCAPAGPNAVTCADTGVTVIGVQLGEQPDKFAAGGPLRVNVTGGG